MNIQYLTFTDCVRVMNEIDAVSDGSSRDWTFNQLESLPYMTQVINECLRLYPPAPATVRDVRAGARLAGYTVPTDCAVIVRVHVLQIYNAQCYKLRLHRE